LVITDRQTEEKGVGLLYNLAEREVREKAREYLAQEY